MPSPLARYQDKATALASAWSSLFGTAIDPHSLILCMAVAELETNLGDWDGSHNWGGIYKRTLTKSEESALASSGVTPTSPNALARARAILTPGTNEILRIDSAPPPRGAYFVWSWAFPDDVAGATRFVKVLVHDRPQVSAILASASPVELAAAMYATHYYEGTSTDPAANIAGYGHNIAHHASAIAGVLGGWMPPGSAVAGGSGAVASVAPSSPGGGSGTGIAVVFLVGLAAFARKEGWI
jgi:hypothetical protein